MREIRFFVLLIAMAMACATRAAERPEVLIETSMGNIRIQLYNETPLHRDNFLKLIRDYQFYDSLLFHRVIPDFMIQAGDPSSKNAPKGKLLGTQSLDYNIPAEIRLPELYHKRGALAAAREPDIVNPKRESSSSQFYIVTGKVQDEKGLERGRRCLSELFGDSITMTSEMAHTYTTSGGAPHLDGAYTVFGEVVEGMDVADSISRVARDTNNRPLDDVRIIRATITRDVPGMQKRGGRSASGKGTARKNTRRAAATARKR